MNPPKPDLECGSASDSLYLTFKGGCREGLTYKDAYRCTGCGGRFHKSCILKHFELEEEHDWGRQEERKKLEALLTQKSVEAKIDELCRGKVPINKVGEVYRTDNGYGIEGWEFESDGICINLDNDPSLTRAYTPEELRRIAQLKASLNPNEDTK